MLNIGGSRPFGLQARHGPARLSPPCLRGGRQRASTEGLYPRPINAVMENIVAPYAGIMIGSILGFSPSTDGSGIQTLPTKLAGVLLGVPFRSLKQPAAKAPLGKTSKPAPNVDINAPVGEGVTGPFGRGNLASNAIGSGVNHTGKEVMAHSPLKIASNMVAHNWLDLVLEGERAVGGAVSSLKQPAAKAPLGKTSKPCG